MTDRVVVYAGTRNLYHNMTVAARSLLEHTRVDRVWFLTEDDDFPEPLPDVIRNINVIGQTWFYADGPNYYSPWTYMTLMRLALAEILPAEHRVLWLDVDTIVEADIGELFDTDLKGRCAAAVVEPYRGGKPFTYYNAGVMLWDLDQVRKTGIWRELIRTVNGRKLEFPDQDAINLRMQEELVTLSPAYNACDWTIPAGSPPVERKIIHFAADRRYSERPGFRKYDRPEWRVKDAGKD